MGFNFNDLFIFEMANNHQGSVEHGKKIINEIADVSGKAGARGAIKLQFRDLDTFIHPHHRDSATNKHISRFLSTRLSEEQFSELVAEIRKRGLISVCTPFDEASVDMIGRLDIEIIKIGSCSARDWPLLERVSSAGKPVICSVGGLTISEIDRVVSFFQHRGIDFALMHCVAVYPTPNAQLYLNQIEIMRRRYPGVTIGFSTHEEPMNLDAVKLAYAKGARIFEKHVGVPAEGITLNSYSATPAQAADWLAAWKEAVGICGFESEERPISDKEYGDLRSLKRGVYAKASIQKGTAIKKSDVFFAMPLQDNQLAVENWKEKLMADRDYNPDEAINLNAAPQKQSKKTIIYSVIHTVKGMLNSNFISLGHDFAVELSHHYGLEKFNQFGCVIIECINREYAKKLIIQLAGQMHPAHYHKRKDETFQVLSGVLEVEIEGRKKTLYPGDTIWVPRGVWHGFKTHKGVIFEEISTASFNDDSFYIDRNIANLPREARKTRLFNWGRHQFDEFDEEGNAVGQYA